jgi:S1-C subfamily serine protease
VGGVLFAATPVFFDPELDLALLRTSAPMGKPLTIDPNYVKRGTGGAITGYPEDGPLTVVPAGVATELLAAGRDIYNQGLVTRDVYELDGVVRPGNSGSPLIATNGLVIGVVFSRSTTNADVGYALASPAVLANVVDAENRTARVSTQSCSPD